MRKWILMKSYLLSIENKVCIEASSKPDNTVLYKTDKQYSNTHRMANYIEGLLPSACQGLSYHSIFNLTLHCIIFNSAHITNIVNSKYICVSVI